MIGRTDTGCHIVDRWIGRVGLSDQAVGCPRSSCGRNAGRAGRVNTSASDRGDGVQRRITRLSIVIARHRAAVELVVIIDNQT